MYTIFPRSPSLSLFLSRNEKLKVINKSPKKMQMKLNGGIFTVNANDVVKYKPTKLLPRAN